MRKSVEVAEAGWVMAVFCIGVTLAGCAHTHDLTTATPRTDIRTTLQGLEGRDVRLALRNGVQADGEVKALDPDTLKLSAGGLPTEMGILYLDIQKITVFNHGNAVATPVGIVVGVMGAYKVAEYVITNNVPVGWLCEIPVPAGMAFGAMIGGTIASQLFPVSDTYIFLSSSPDTVLLLVDRLFEHGDKTIRVRIRNQSYTLPAKECEVVRQPDGVYVKASRAVFRKAGIPMQ